MNQYNPNIHHRKSIRLKGYDYSQPGLYFITICIDRLKNRGMMPVKWLKMNGLELPERFKNIKLHQYVVMPNHFHAILEIVVVGATLVVAQNHKTNNLNAPNQ